MQAEKAAGFLGACLPQGAHPLAWGSAPLRGPGAAALNRLAVEGMAWAPTAGNLVALLCFALAIALNAQLTQASELCPSLSTRLPFRVPTSGQTCRVTCLQLRMRMRLHPVHSSYLSTKCTYCVASVSVYPCCG
jgi:hypothetical protein